MLQGFFSPGNFESRFHRSHPHVWGLWLCLYDGRGSKGRLSTVNDVVCSADVKAEVTTVCALDPSLAPPLSHQASLLVFCLDYVRLFSFGFGHRLQLRRGMLRTQKQRSPPHCWEWRDIRSSVPCVQLWVGDNRWVLCKLRPLPGVPSNFSLPGSFNFIFPSNSLRSGGDVFQEEYVVQGYVSPRRNLRGWLGVLY